MPIAIMKVGGAGAGFRLMEPRIFVDLDGTLKTQYEKSDGDLSIEFAGKTWRFSKRPYADEFLSALRKMGRVYLTTAAARGYARKVVSALGLEGYFDDIYAAESYPRGLPLYMNWVLIDDSEELAVLKARTMGSNAMASEADLKKRIVLVKPYRGGDDGELKDVLKAVEKVVNE
jgi:hypothetical protein